MESFTDHNRVLQLIDLSYTIRTHSIGEIEFILLPEEYTDYIAICGTELSGQASHTAWERIQDIWDIVRDLRILPWPVKIQGIEYKGHAGFIRGAIRVANAIEKDLRDVPLVIGGHSLGGAIALVVGLILAKRGKKVEIVTVGAPHVFCSRVPIPDNVALTMYKYGRDIVTYVPIGRHPVKQTVVGKASSRHPNAKDHSLAKYRQGVRQHLWEIQNE